MTERQHGVTRSRRREGRLLAGTFPWVATAAAILSLVVPGAIARAAIPRFPTLHGDTVVFSSGGNLWSVSRSGGVARRLTTDVGPDIMPRFSPDGQSIAFTGAYDGEDEVYVMPAQGGTPQRLTFHSDVVKDAPLRWGPSNMVIGWTPDGSSVVFLSRRDTFNSWFGRLFTVSAKGGLPQAMPLPKGGVLSFSPDGGKIAYNRIFRNFRTWKRYHGGLAQDVWTYDLSSHASERVTDWKGTDTYPMWYGGTIYFASDRGSDQRLNIWAYDTKTKAFREVTHFTDYDVDWPSLGDTGLVFQCGGHLYVLDLPSEQLHKVAVTVAGDNPQMRASWVDATKHIRSFDISPNGKRALFGARGEVFTVPAEHGDVRDLTQTSGAREQYPAWSPDGTQVAYVTDRNGEAQIAVRPADGSGSESMVTGPIERWLYDPVWSPDGKKLAYSDSQHTLFFVTLADHKIVKVDDNPRQEIHDYSWSPDSRWLTYSKSDDNGMRTVYLYSLASAKATAVTSGETFDYEPDFGSEGKYLFFISLRHSNPVPSQVEFDFATLKMGGIYVATLQASEPSPFKPRSDEGTPEKESDKPKPGTGEKEGKAEKEAPAPVKIDLEGIGARLVPLPIPAANIDNLMTAKDRVYYMTAPNPTLEGPLPGVKPELHVFDMKTRKDSVITSPLEGYALSEDGSSVLVQNGKSFTIMPAGPAGGHAPAGAEAHELDLSAMKANIDPPEEWQEEFGQAWRLERDFFFSEKMNGVDWAAERKRYEPLLKEATCREDVNYIIGEMLGELSNSHTYVGGGDVPSNPYVPVGLLGVDFALDTSSGRYRLAKIYPGDNSRDAFRSPLTEPGIDVKEGDYLLAVDGHELKAPTNPYSLFVNTVGRTVTLKVADDAGGKNSREVTVKPIPDELQIRLKAWIDHNREHVNQASNGKIGYIYLSDMEAQGMDEFIRQYYPQIRKEGLVVDVRWNGGGFIDQVLLERLRRVLVGMATNRERVGEPIPEQVLHGYKACLINHYSASDGDIFPFYFRKYGLGPLIGTRTWGGVRGIRGYWELTDGGYVTIPEDSLYGLDSQWVIENHGVDPDVEVDDLPGDVMAGKDTQLDKAIQIIMDKLATQPMKLPPPPPLLPAYPPGIS
jgi:tricorn protease